MNDTRTGPWQARDPLSGGLPGTATTPPPTFSFQPRRELDAETRARAVERARERWRLTPRQGDVLNQVMQGLTNAGVGSRLGIREGTVEYHLTAIFARSGTRNRAALIARVLDD